MIHVARTMWITIPRLLARFACLIGFFPCLFFVCLLVGWFVCLFLVLCFLSDFGAIRSVCDVLIYLDSSGCENLQKPDCGQLQEARPWSRPLFLPRAISNQTFRRPNRAPKYGGCHPPHTHPLHLSWGAPPHTPSKKSAFGLHGTPGVRLGPYC